MRHYGLLAAAHKTPRLVQARAALALPAPNPIAAQTAAEFMRRVAGIEIDRCPHCGDVGARSSAARRSALRCGRAPDRPPC